MEGWGGEIVVAGIIGKRFFGDVLGGGFFGGEFDAAIFGAGGADGEAWEDGFEEAGHVWVGFLGELREFLNEDFDEWILNVDLL